MGLINPTKPADGNTATAGSVNTPFNAIINEINGNLDSANIKAQSLSWNIFNPALMNGVIPQSALENGANLEVFRKDAGLYFVVSGFKWTIDSGLTAEMTAGKVYNYVGEYHEFPSIEGRTFTANKDTYVSIDDDDNMVYQEVANGAAAPTLGTDHMWIAIIATGAITITSITDIARRRVDSEPVGVVKGFAGAIAPDGYLLCQGQAISRTTYADLFAVIGTLYGVGNGSTTFNIPNAKGRTAVGLDSGQTEFDTLGETGGAKTHTLVAGEIPNHTHGVGTLVTASTGAHTHSISDPGHSHVLRGFQDWGGYNPRLSGSPTAINMDGNNYTTNTYSSTTGITINSAGAHTHTISGSTGAVGSDTAHNNLQPYLVMNSIIKW